jgi:serine protease Do
MWKKFIGIGVVASGLVASKYKHRNDSLRQSIVTNAVKATYRIETSVGNNVMYGSGFAIDKDTIVTCHHVIENEDKIKLFDHLGNIRKCEVVTICPNKDLAFIKLSEHKTDDFFHIKCTKRETGKKVFSVSVVDDDEKFSLVDGMTGSYYVSKNDKRRKNVNMVQLNMYIPGGYSGSPVVDFYGRLIGINSQSYEPENMITFAVTSDEIIEEYEKCDLHQ